MDSSSILSGGFIPWSSSCGIRIFSKFAAALSWLLISLAGVLVTELTMKHVHAARIVQCYAIYLLLLRLFIMVRWYSIDCLDHSSVPVENEL